MLVCLAFPWSWVPELRPKVAAVEEGAVGAAAEAVVEAAVRASSSPRREEGVLAVAPVADAILAPAVARAGGAVVWLTFGSAMAAGAPVAVRVAESSSRNAARAA